MKDEGQRLTGAETKLMRYLEQHQVRGQFKARAKEIAIALNLMPQTVHNGTCTLRRKGLISGSMKTGHISVGGAA